MKDRVRAEITKTNIIVVNQSAEERMNGNAKSTEEVILENNQFIRMGCGKVLTSRRVPPHCCPIGPDLVHHQVVERHVIADGWRPLFITVDLAHHLLRAPMVSLRRH